MNEILNRNIQKFYDASSRLWEETWGEHMHHGYYGPDGMEKRDHYQAQIDLIEELLKWGEISDASQVLDVGCGIGGSALYLADKLDAGVTGITLSPVQAERARQRAISAGLKNRAVFFVADALAPALRSRAFDLVWSLESGEHIPDKRRFLATCHDLLTSGGRFLMATWCHRPLPPKLTPGEHRFLQRLYRAYHLPDFISIREYETIASECGFKDIHTADWTRAVAPFWKAVVRSAFSPKSISGLARAGWLTIRGALAMNLMIRGYRSGLICFVLLQGTKK